MALSKDFDAKNGFLGGINIKPLNVSNNQTKSKTEEPKVKSKEAPLKNEIKKEKTLPKKESKISNEITEHTIKEPVKEPKVKTNKGGRPKKYEVEKIRTTIFIPKDILDESEYAKMKFNGSRSDYIVDLIRKDLETNKSEYDALKKIFNKK